MNSKIRDPPRSVIIWSRCFPSSRSGQQQLGLQQLDEARFVLFLAVEIPNKAPLGRWHIQNTYISCSCNTYSYNNYSYMQIYIYI